MSSIPDRSQSSRRVDLEAAAWLVKHDRGLTASEQDDFLQWLAADPSHQEWFARHSRTWQEFNLISQWRPEHSAEPNPDLLARPHCRRRSVRVWSGTLATASVALAWIFWPARLADQKQVFPTEIVAATYEQRRLEDGSVVDLNRGAHLTVEFTPGKRRVRLLQGEAQFTVARNAARPFVVHAGGIDVQAVGTAFNVRLAGGEVEVLVTEGKVRLGRSGPAPDPVAADRVVTADRRLREPAPIPPPWPQLVAGQRTVISVDTNAPAPRIMATTAADMTRLLLWQPQLLEFDSTPLNDVLAEFNRRNTTQLVVADEELNNVPIVASFRSDNLDGFVRLLEVTADIRAERRGANTIVLRKAP